METELRRVDQTMDQLDNQLATLLVILKQANTEQLRVLLRNQENIEILLNRLENKSRVIGERLGVITRLAVTD